MREIKAYVRPERVEAVVTALEGAGVPHVTVTHVRSFGGPLDAGDRRISLEAGDWYMDMAKLECVCVESDVSALVRVVEVAARTGEPGDGIVYVTPVEGAVKVRTGAEGREALA